jgi:nucleoid DNA-binding protein
MILGGKVLHPLFDATRSLDPQIADLLTASLVASMREALLSGDVVTVPGVGRLQVRGRRRYGVTHPTSGETTMMGGERTVVFQPDRTLLRELNIADEGRASPPSSGRDDVELRHDR